MLVSVDAEWNVRYLLETADFPRGQDEENVMEFLEKIEDDSTWKNDVTLKDFVELLDDRVHSKVIAQIEKDF